MVVSTMPARLAGVSLKGLAPTEEELAQARCIIAKASAKERRAKEGSMMHFLKQNGGHEGPLTGESRADYLVRFLTYQMRAKNVKRTMGTSLEVTHTDKKGTLWLWMSAETMDSKLGVMKATHWRESKLLKERADSLTGSSDEALKEYKVPKDWEELTSEDLKSLCLKAEAEATEEDLEGTNQFSHKAPQGEQLNPIKAEPLTEIEKFEKKVKDFLENMRNTFDEFTDMVVKTQQIQADAKKGDDTKCNYASLLLKDVDSHLAKLNKTTKILQAAVIEAPKGQEIPKLLDAVEGMRAEHEKIESWALKFGLANAPKPKRRKR